MKFVEVLQSLSVQQKNFKQNAAVSCATVMLTCGQPPAFGQTAAQMAAEAAAQKSKSINPASQIDNKSTTIEHWSVPGAAKLPLPTKKLLGKDRAPAEEIGVDINNLVSLVNQDRSAIDLRAVGDQIISFRRKVTEHPQDGSLRYKLAAYLYLAGDLEGAGTELKRGVGLRPDDWAGHVFLAKILDDVGDRETATSEYKRAIELAPDQSEPHLLYADSLVAKGEVSSGINEYRRAIDLKKSVEGYSGLAEALLLMHDAAGGIKAARRAVSVEPGSARAHVALTKALVLAGDTQPSLRTARQAVLLNPVSADSHIALGRSLYAKGDRNGAVDEFRQAVSLDPLSAQARNDLGYALYGRGDTMAAVNEFRLALRLNPHLNEARNNLEIAIHGLLGRKK